MLERPGFLSLAGFAVLLLAIACGDDVSSAAAPSASGGAPRTGDTPPSSDDGPTDAGTAVDAAASLDAERDVLANECETIDAVLFTAEDSPIDEGLLTRVTTPMDFPVTRVEGTWEPGCANPTFRITLSEGRCPDGRGQELVFYLESEAIESGDVHTGQNVIAEERGARGIRVRYLRPDGVRPSGEWGTCGPASGTVDFMGDVALLPRAELQATFQLELPACDGDMAETRSVRGAFNVTVRRSETDFCPADDAP